LAPRARPPRPPRPCRASIADDVHGGGSVGDQAHVLQTVEGSVLQRAHARGNAHWRAGFPPVRPGHKSPLRVLHRGTLRRSETCRLAGKKADAPGGSLSLQMSGLMAHWCLGPPVAQPVQRKLLADADTLLSVARDRDLHAPWLLPSMWRARIPLRRRLRALRRGSRPAPLATTAHPLAAPHTPSPLGLQAAACSPNGSGSAGLTTSSLSAVHTE
jgi:hypothetical protein